MTVVGWRPNSVANPRPSSGDHTVTTSGGEGPSLVKGKQVTLKAVALSIKEDGVVDSITIGGQLATRGANVTTLEVEGTVRSFDATGGVLAEGKDSDAARVGEKGEIDLDGVTLLAVKGEGLVRG